MCTHGLERWYEQQNGRIRCMCGIGIGRDRVLDLVTTLRLSLEEAAIALEDASKGAPMSAARLAAEIVRARLSGKETL